MHLNRLGQPTRPQTQTRAKKPNPKVFDKESYDKEQDKRLASNFQEATYLINEITAFCNERRHLNKQVNPIDVCLCLAKYYVDDGRTIEDVIVDISRSK